MLKGDRKIMKKIKWNENWYFWEMLDSFALLWNTPENAKKVKLFSSSEQKYEKSKIV